MSKFWKIAIIVMVVAITSIIATGCGDASSSNQDNQSNGSDVKSNDWFSDQIAKIGAAELSLAEAQNNDEEQYQRYFRSTCSSIEYPTGSLSCKERYEKDSFHLERLKGIQSAEKTLKDLTEVYDKEAEKAGRPPYKADQR